MCASRYPATAVKEETVRFEMIVTLRGQSLVPFTKGKQVRPLYLEVHAAAVRGGYNDKNHNGYERRTAWEHIRAVPPMQ